ncbi:MAG: hypothetical protein [Vetruanivirus porcinprimi]|uniref:Uncharacterized protein n=1 Tax=phage Lak_Megaphage_RVC_AP1_GC26 TaxID=3109224 RepID=A0ABZ0Z8G2_9CAUD|nr:MAG: hypothetical protein [phage Lak_Megaphage_RVC_AP1_GC26]
MKTFEKNLDIYNKEKKFFKDKKTMRLFNNIYKNNVNIYADSFNWDKQVRYAYMLQDIVNS